jgi:hypothetical protein
MVMDKEKKEVIEKNLVEEFNEIRKKVKTVRKACDTILDAAEEALKTLVK